ncbi:hypothetical protein [Cetobacterium sp.]|uniref:hypothetical protein n=1 Tax=Cetobacterium sp. TaxID=2071632 RepID=UPI003F2D562D
MIYVLGAALGASVVYGVMQSSRLRLLENENEKISKEYTNCALDKKVLQKERSELLENINELREENGDLSKENEDSQKCWEELKKISDRTEVDRKQLYEKCKQYKDSLEKREGQLGFADITIKNLETKVSDLKEQLKLEDEASCKIIKELEDMVAELERENKLKDDKIAYEIGEKKNYMGYIDYVINAPRAIRRRFANGEKVDWIDENGVLRMRMVEER